MTRPLLVLRPEPGCSETLSAAREMGLEATAAPLFVIESVAWVLPDPLRFDALLAGSANVFRHGGPGLDALRHLPVFAVGESTAGAAIDAGFAVAATGRGGLQPLLDEINPPASLLRLAGEARVDLSPPAGIEVTERIVYRAVPRPIEAGAIDILHGDAVVLLHSAEAARAFSDECDRIGITRSKIAIAALAPRIAAACGDGWSRVRTTPETSDSALLALAADMCH